MNKYELNIIPDFLKGYYAQYKAYTKHYAKSFYFASFLLPEEKRNAAYAVYAFCRYADNITDISKYESESYMLSKIQYLTRTLEEVYHQVESGSEVISDFSRAIREYGIPKEYFSELIDGVATDISRKEYENFAELEIYCYKVASVVGLIMTHIFGYSDKAVFPYAVMLGKAMQLTNILRDIAEDYSLGRIYLPKEEMNTFGYDEDDLKKHVINESFVNMMKFQIERARDYYEKSKNGLKFLTNDGSRTAVILMTEIYGGILKEIENNGYDIYCKRHYVSTFKKLLITARLIITRKAARHDFSEDSAADYSAKA